MGKPIDEITIDDLAVVDEFHVRGQAATNELIEAAGLLPGSKILDMGCGLGGSARRLASRLDCRVTGLDLSEEYVTCAKYLTSLLKLEDKVSFETASCLEMPFDDDEFDAILSIQMMMNIDDKAGLIEEIRRVLKSGGKFVFYEILEGDGQDPYFPVPWAQEPTHNALCSPTELRTLLSDNGFEIAAWEDKTEISKQAIEGMSPPSNNAK